MAKKLKEEYLINKYIIDPNNLRKGDIIFSTTNEWKSKIIRRFTKSDYSHVMLYVDRHSIIHADSDGVHSLNTQRKLFEDEEHCIVYRLKESISEEKINVIINYLRNLIGTPYSTIEAMLSPYYKGDITTERVFCSRLVGSAFDKANIKLVENSSYCTPEEIKKSSLLEIITNPLRKPSEVEKSIILNTVDKVEIQTNVTNELFKSIQKITSNSKITIQEQLTDFLKENKDFDTKISSILRKSGYLTLWVEELKSNTPLYDIRLYPYEVSPEQKIEFSKVSPDTYLRYKNMQLEFKKLYDEHQLETFKDLYSLYCILVNNASNMLETVTDHRTTEIVQKFSQFFKILVNIFYIRRNLLSIQEDNSYDDYYFNFTLETINLVNNNLNKVKSNILKYNLIESFDSINNIIIEISSILENIIYIEVRKKRDSKSLFDKLSNKTDELIDIIDNIEYTNIVINL